MDIVDPNIDEYLDKTLAVPTALLWEMERYGTAQGFPTLPVRDGVAVALKVG